MIIAISTFLTSVVALSFLLFLPVIVLIIFPIIGFILVVILMFPQRFLAIFYYVYDNSKLMKCGKVRILVDPFWTAYRKFIEFIFD
jgi:hypothetical protein